MKFVKGISLFFLYPALMFVLGFGAGIYTMDFFYPGIVENNRIKDPSEYNADIFIEDVPENTPEPTSEMLEVVASEETLNADTQFVLWEMDIVKETLVETSWSLPEEYIGLNRTQFLESMAEYEMFPPLAEMERGFVNLQVISFAPEKVVVQMNYQFVQPSKSFYLAVRDNEVIVLLEDKQTLFINTGIRLDSLPEEEQIKIIKMLWVENEKALYSFLENHSS